MIKKKTLSTELLHKMDAYWRATNYLSVGQIYLYDNPLLKEPLKLSHVKPMVVGHWGTTPGQNFIYVHLNRIIKEHDLDMFYIAGPGHGGPALVSNTYLEGSYSEIYPNISQDEEGMKKLFKQFSFPGGISSHVAPTTPGSIHEGGELGYSLSHAFGAALDNPDLIVACVIGDGEAETGPLATAWHSNKFLNPITDGTVLPILHLNGYKISNPTILARIEHEELEQFLKGCGWTPYFVEGDEPEKMHELMASAMENGIKEIRQIQSNARSKNDATRPRWPMIVLRSPKGWTGPKVVDGQQIEGTFRSHQVPLLVNYENPDHVKLLESWMKSYKAEELFDKNGCLIPELAELAPKGTRRMGANPHANGGILMNDLRMPDFRVHAVDVPSYGGVDAQDTLVLGSFLRDVVKLNKLNFRIFGPDETESNLLGAVFEATDRQWDVQTEKNDEFLAPAGRVLDSMLSEHQCEGWLEGYLLTGRHGLFNSYEAFIRIVDSMFSQHAKWLKVTKQLPWRHEIASLNYLLTSHVWQQDHNGFTHQDPGFLDHVINKKADIVRVYLPPDANCLLSGFDHCLRSRDYVNVVVAGKHAMPQWLNMGEAVVHCTEGIGIWQWASNDQDSEPDVVMACCGDTPTLEILAAVSILHKYLPDLKIRVINVVDLMKLQPSSEHPHGLTDIDYDSLFTKDKLIIFGFHGYPWLVHRLTYRRTNRNLHVRGYVEEGTITTAFDIRVQNKLDRFNLVQDVVDRLPNLGSKGAYLKQMMQDKLIEHNQYIDKYGIDLPEIRNWKWSSEVKSMKENHLIQFGILGQSIWLDYIRRDLITSGELRRLITEDGLRGMTSNPSIFEKAISNSHDYDEDIHAMAIDKKDFKSIYEALSQHDVQSAADDFRSVYDETDGKDGYVSLEVNPHLAHDAVGTIAEARRLWKALNRPNVLIKVPATAEGLQAIQQLISEGVNINVTLLFGLPRYRQVAEAYIAGIEARLAKGKPVGHVASVASFFVSRIDTLVDSILEKIIAKGGNEAQLAKQIRGQVAIASAKVAYQIYKEIFSSDRYKKLAERGASTQRLLWASTGTKNAEYSDVKYIEALIGVDTVNTVPVETLEAYRDHGEPKVRIEDDIDGADRVLQQLHGLGINIDTVTQQLEDEGVAKFNKPFDELMETLARRIDY